jgi:serralysin
MSTGAYSDFLTALGQNESGNNYAFVSSAGYLGRYQFGEEALKSIGFYGGDSTTALDFVGSWTSTAQAYGVNSKESFLASSAAQDAAVHAWFDEVDAYLVSLHLADYVGQTIGGVQITTSGLLAGAHLVGVPALQSYLQSNGAIDTVDYYGCPVSQYVKQFAGYATPYDPAAPASPAAPVGLTGTAGADTLAAHDASLTLTGGGGDDLLTGGAGHTIAVYGGAEANYAIAATAAGWAVTDLRAGSPDGSDLLRDISELQFSDGVIPLGHAVALAPAVAQAIGSVLRQDASVDPVTGSGHSPASALGNELSFELSTGTIDTSAMAGQVVVQAASTSSVATLAYEFFTGSAPSAAGMDYLVSPSGPNPNNLNSAYYQAFGLENRYINFASNLGRAGQGSAGFASQYAGLSPEQAMTKAYQTIFGGTPSADKVDHLLHDQVPDGLGGTYERVAYFESYGGDGPSGIGTKAAMVGWLMAEAVKDDLGTYAKSNDAFLTDVALHNAPFGVDIVGHYDQPGFAYQPG